MLTEESVGKLERVTIDGKGRSYVLALSMISEISLTFMLEFFAFATAKYPSWA